MNKGIKRNFSSSGIFICKRRKPPVPYMVLKVKEL
jgi:hypothetical protein